MATILFKAQADYDEVIKLREEIYRLKKELSETNSKLESAKFDKLNGELLKAEERYKKLTDEAIKAGSGIEKSSISIAKALGAIGGIAALKQLGSQIMSVRGQFQEMETSIKTLVGGDMASKLLPQIKELAKVSPLTMTDIVGAEKMMLGFNIEADKTIGFLKALSDVSMGSSQKFNSLTLAFSQMSATGKLMGQDLNQMINAGFNPLQSISQRTGKSISQLKEEMSKGAISAEMVQQAFLDATSAGGKFYKMSENASKTINGQLSMLQDAMDNVFNELGQQSEGIMLKGIQATTSLVQNYEKIGKILVSLVSTYGTYKAATLAATVVEEGTTKAIWAKVTATKAATVAQAAFNAVAKANPYVLLATAVIGVATAVWALSDNTSAAEKEAKRLEERNEELNKKLGEEKEEINSLLAVLNDENATQVKKQEAYDKLVSKYPEIFAKYKNETDLINNQTGALKQLNEQQERRLQLQNLNNARTSEQQLKDLKEMQSLWEVVRKQSMGSGDSPERKRFNELFAIYGNELGRNNLGKSIADAIAAKTDSVKKDNEIVKKQEKTVWEASVNSMSKDRAQMERDYLERIKNELTSSGASQTVLSGETQAVSVEDITNRIKYLNEKVLDVEWKGAKDYQAQAKKAWEDAKKEVDRVKAGKYKSQDDFQKALTKAEEAEKNAKKVYQGLGGEVSTKSTTKKTDSEKQYNKEILNLKKANQKEELDLLKDGVEKEKAIIENAYVERMNELSALQEKWSSEQNGTLTDDQLNTLVTAAGIAFSKRNKEISDIEKAQNEKDEKNRLEYLAKYGSYLEKRNAIIEKYNKELQGVESGSWEEKGILARQKDELDTLDKTLLEDSELWSKCFGGFENRSTSALKRIIKEIQGLIDYMNGVEGAELPDMFAQNENAVKAINDAMKDPGATQKFVQNLSVTKAKFTKMLDEKNPFKQISEGFKNKDSESMAKGFQQIAGAIDTAKQAMDALGISQESTLGKAADIAGKTASYAAQGAQIGGAYGAAIGGAIGLASGLVGAFGADYSQYKKLVEEYEGLIDVWDTLIDRKMEYLSMSWGAETSKAREEAIALVNKEAEAWKELGLAKLNAGASAGSHSIGVRMAKDTSTKDWEDIARGLGMSVSKAREVIDGSAVGGRMQGLFSLSVDQLKSLQENAPAFWAKMDEDVRKYLESIIDGEKRLEDIEKTAQERLTQTTFDNVYNDFVSKLMDMKSRTKDFTQDISEMFMQAMLSNEIGKLYSDKLKKWYEKFAKSIESGTMSSSDRDALSEEYKQYVAEALNIRDELAKTTGYNTAYSQSASTGYSVSMNQDTGDALVGRATGIQEGIERLNVKTEESGRGLSLLSIKADEIKAISVERRDIANDTRNILANSYLELREINENTGNSSRYLKSIKDDVTEIRNKTKNL